MIFWQHGFLKLNGTIVFTWAPMIVLAVGAKLIARNLSTEVEQTGAAALFLPPSSPDFNPIEKMGSKVKACLRSAEARTPSSLLEAIAAALTSVTPQDAINWFASCG